MTKRKVVIPLEISEISEEILPVVRHLFDPFSVSLTLLAVARPLEAMMVRNVYMTELPPASYAPMIDEESWAVYRKGIEERLQREARHLRNAGYTVATVVCVGETVHEIVNFVEQGDFDLLAMATFGRKGLSRLVFGSIAEQILRMVSVPMLLIRPHLTAKRESPVRSQVISPLSGEHQSGIVVATDGAPHTQQAIRLAQDIARALRADLKVLVAASEREGATYAQKVMQETQALLQEVDPQPELIPLIGPPDEVIGRYLEESPADLLVLGAFKDLDAGAPTHIGITAHRIVQYTPMSVLMLKGQNIKFERILACVTVAGTPVVDSALQLAKALNAKLEFLHVLPSSTEPRPQPVRSDDPALSILLDHDPRLSAFLRKTTATLNEWGLDSNVLQVWRGDILKTILEVARHGSHDLIMMGNHSGPHYFIDTLANSVVSFAPKSVLIVRNRVQ